MKPKAQIKKIGKIGVKHILIKYATKKANKKEPGSPVYVKVTFNRKSTQFLSVVKEKFINIDDANKKYAKLFDYETKLIKDIVKKRASRYEDIFNIAGIGEEVKIFDNFIYGFIEDNLYDHLNFLVNNSDSPYKNLVIIAKKEINPSTFFEAHRKLFGSETFQNYLINYFENADNVFKLIQKSNEIKNIHLLDWLYGDGKNILRINAKATELKNIDVDSIVQFIDNLLID